MRKVLVTGASGFIGKNLCLQLEQQEETEVLRYNRSNTRGELETFIEQADFIFHLAGVNRPQSEEEFDIGNHGFTEEIISILESKAKSIPVVLTSSIQAEKENQYGKSKMAAEETVKKWSSSSKAPSYIYRLPNVFGKWCRPNYNSVVATFCHNIARGTEIQINDPTAQVTFAYVDDVVRSFINTLNITDASFGTTEYLSIDRTFPITLQQLADKLYELKDMRSSLIVPNLEDDFSRFLYATYTSYFEEDDYGYRLDKKSDNRGWLAEFIKSKHFGQVFISKTRPGISRGNHWHHTKIEKFLVIEGEGEIKFRNPTSNKVFSYKVNGEDLRVVDIPAGLVHSITNVGRTDLLTLFWADEIFNLDQPDTYYQEV